MPKFRENILEMSPYLPPLEGRASQGYLLLDFNEMTVEPSPRVKKALKDFVDSGRLQAYPEYRDITSKIAEYAGVNAIQVMLTNGSDQGIDVIMRAFLERGDKVIIPTPSFAMFYQSAQIQGADILKPLYREDLSFPLEETLELMSKDVRLVVVCNPNNPTGTAVPKDALLKILRRAKESDIAVLHDEAYFEFSGITSKDLIDEFDNLFITRTLSKQFGIASVRAGYVITQETNVHELMKIRGPYDVNMFAITAISAALSDVQHSQKYIKEVMTTSKVKLETFLKENNVTYYPSVANFILLKPDDQQKALALLKSRGILVRPRDSPNIQGTLRVSVGTVKDIDRFIKAYSILV